MTSHIQLTKGASGWLVRRDAAQAAAWRAQGAWSRLTLACHARAAAADCPEHIVLIDKDKALSTAAVTEGTRPRADIDYGAETDGWVGATQVRLVHPGSDTPVAAGEGGEILAFGAQIFAGYTRPKDNVDAFAADGFFRTGDLGRMGDRYLIVTGRLEDLIIRNGKNLSAKEIEDALEDLPGISEIANVGIPSEKTGEAVCAVVAVQGPSRPDLAAVGAHLSAKGLARQKIPERIVVVNELPRNLAGKVLKDILCAKILKNQEPGEYARPVVASSVSF